MPQLIRKAYYYDVQPIFKGKESSSALNELQKIMQNWVAYLDHYATQAATLFKGGESLFCRGNESMCVASIGSAMHRSNKSAISAIEMPTPKDTKSGFLGRTDLWLHTGKQQFYIEGKLRRDTKKPSQLLTTYVGAKGKGSASSLISTGFRDLQKSAGTWHRISKKNKGFCRVMLLMVRLDVGAGKKTLNEVMKEMNAIFTNTEQIVVFRNARTRALATAHKHRMSEYDHSILAMVPTGNVELKGVHASGFVAVATIF